MINCPNCGTANDEQAKLCNLCGKLMAQKTANPTNTSPTLTPPPIRVAAASGATNTVRPQIPIAQRTNGFAIASVVLALLGVTSLLGLIFAIIALVQIGDGRGATSGRGLAITGLVISILLPIPIMLAILFPVFAKAREKARQEICINNQKYFVEAAEIFSQENNNTLVNSWEQLSAGLPPKVLICPNSNNNAKNNYGMNSLTLGSPLADITVPARSIFTADSDSPDNLLHSSTDVARRHSKGCIASYIDGHVGYLNEYQGIIFLSPEPTVIPRGAPGGAPQRVPAPPGAPGANM